MRSSKRFDVAVASVAIGLIVAATSHGQYSYNFDNGNVIGSPTPGTPLINSTTIGTTGQDSWVLTSGTTGPLVRTDPLTGFSGNYIRSTVADATTTTQDTIVTRWNGSSLGLTNQFATLSADILVGVGGQGTSAPIYRRSEVAVGVDSTGDQKIRATASANENAEWGFTFGYEAAGTGSGWYIRPADLGTAVIGVAPNVSGVWTAELVVDLTANSNNGSGSLYIKQIADEAGNPVSDVFRLADPALANFNLGIQRQTTGSAGGSAYAANPANWDGILARVAGNGGIDNIVFSPTLPTTPPTWASNAGSWLISGNWYLSVPNAIDAEADFTSGAKVDSTVYADAAVTVGKILFNSTHTYNISGTGSLTMQVSTGSALVDVQGGSQKINLPLSIASNTTLNVASGTTLRISDPVTVQPGKSLTQSGAGTVLYESTINVLTGGGIAFANSVHGASLALGGTGSTAVINSPSGGGTSVVKFDALSLATGSSLDIKTNELDSAMSDATTVAHIKAGRIFTSVSTSGRGVGYGPGTGGLERVVYTLLGDTNLDRTVNFNDLVSLAQNYGLSGKFWSQGDFNYDGVVNFNDLVPLAQNYNGSLGAVESLGGSDFQSDWKLALAVAPEPTSLAVIGGVMSLIARRRRA